jgi:predicted acylesterase/phospholipase RssA
MDEAIPPIPCGDRGRIGLCLSGGGYRAMLFHTGALWRLNELGWLPRLDVVSSVSGGSIAAGVLAHGWAELDFTDGVAGNFREVVVAPLRRLASRNLDIPVTLRGLLKPWRSVGEELAGSYRRHLFGEFTRFGFPEPAGAAGGQADGDLGDRGDEFGIHRKPCPAHPGMIAGMGCECSR